MKRASAKVKPLEGRGQSLEAPVGPLTGGLHSDALGVMKAALLNLVSHDEFKTAVLANNEAEFSTPLLDCAFNLSGHKFKLR